MTDLDFINRPITIQDPPDFKVVSTFAGCGGSSTGYVWAGGKVMLAVEWDDNAVETYRLNYPDTTIYHGDIAKLSVDEALTLSGVEPYELDIFDGSPPCQGFSTAGKRNIDDPRNQLFREYVRLLKGFMPKVFVMENVSGMVKGKMKLLFAEILKELKSCGYQVSAKLLDAMYLGVPQSRQRMIFIGVRDDLGIQPSHPKPQTRPIPVKDAWNNLARVVEPESDIRKYAIGAEWQNLKQGQKSNKYLNLIRISPNKPSPALTKGAGEYPSGASVTHFSECRKYSIGEARRVSSFPDLYNFTDYYHALERIGNSVPPEMMRRIALHIKQTILTPAHETSETY